MKANSQNQLYNIENENHLDIFYLFFGITRKILWQISPNLRNYMLKE
jgi:hypothetical protein